MSDTKYIKQKGNKNLRDNINIKVKKKPICIKKQKYLTPRIIHNGKLPNQMTKQKAQTHTTNGKQL